MDSTGEYRLPAPLTRVWAALGDPDVLGSCLPGCTAVVRTGPDSFLGRFAGQEARWNFSQRNGPDGLTGSYTAPGASGSVEATLTQDGSFTLIRYTIHAVGPAPDLDDPRRLRFADRFLRALTEHAAAPAPVGAEGLAGLVSPLPNTPSQAPSIWSRLPREPLGLPIAAWIGVPIFGLIAFLLVAG